MKTYAIQKIIFNTEKMYEDLSKLISLWEEENIEISFDSEKPKRLKKTEKNIKKKLTEIEKNYQKMKENISF
jgi:DUF4097 and DUF4098 domain-containing protein YvlB